MADPTRDQLMAALRKADKAGDVPAAQAIARRINAIPAAQAQQAPQTRVERRKEKERTWGQTITGGLRDVARGVADVPDMLATAGHYLNPVMLGAKALGTGADKLLGTKIAPQAPRAWGNVGVEKAADFLGAGKSEEGGYGERVTGAGIRGLASALVPVPGATILGAGKGLATKGIEALAGFSGGAVGKAAEEAKLPVPLQVAAALAAGVAPTAAVSTVRNAGGGIRAATKFDPTGGKELAARRMQDVAGDPKQATEAIARNLTNRPGVNPLTGEIAESPNLAALQREVEDTSILEAQRVNAQNRGAIASGAMGKGDIADTRVAAADQARVGRGELETRKQAVARQRAALEAEREAGRTHLGTTRATELEDLQVAGESALTQRKRALGTVVDEETSGKNLRERYEAAYDEVKQKVRSLYEAIPDVPLSFSGGEAKQLFDNMAGVASKWIATRPGAKMPGGLKDMLFGTADSPQGILHLLDDNALSTKKLTDIDQDLAELAGQARMGKRNREANFIDDLRRQIDEGTADKVPEEYRGMLSEAKAARRDQAQRFEHGVVGQTFGTKNIGEENVPDLLVPKKLTVTGPEGGQASKQLTQALDAGVTEKFVREEMARRVDAGVPLTDAFMRNNRQMLARNPTLKADIDAIRAQQQANIGAIKAHGDETALQAAEHGQETKRLLSEQDAYAASRLDEQQKRIAEFEQSPLGSIVRKDTTDPHEAVVSILSGKNSSPEMEKLAHQLRYEPAAQEGVRRSIGDYIGKAGSVGATFDKAGNLIPNNRSTISAIENVLNSAGTFLDDAQRQVLKNIQDELKRADFADTGGKLTREGSKDRSIPGPSQTARLIRFVMARASNHDQVQAVIREAMIDPKKAVDLLGRKTPDRMARWHRTIRSSTAASARASQQFISDDR